MENKTKVMKEVTINDVKVRLELSESEAEDFPAKIVSTIRIKDKELEPISARSIFF